MRKTVVVKVGTSTLLGSGGGLDERYISDLAGELSRLARAGGRPVLVSSGAIRAGCERLGWEYARTVPMKQAAAAVGQGLLMERYSRAFGRRGMAVAQVLLTRQDAAERARHVNARNTLTTLLRHGVLPVVNENDTVAVDEIRFGENDTLSAQVAALVHADLLILLTDVEGLLDSDGNLIPVVPEIDGAIALLCQRPGKVGTGGMASKVAAAEIASAAGVRTHVAQGRPPSVIGRIVRGEACGTQFPPRPRRLPGRKHWIAFSQLPRGKLSVHPLARVALVERHTSLLPAGIVGVDGVFSRGDIVSLAGEGGEEFARGIVSCGSEEVLRVMGLHTAEARRRIGRGDFQEVIHRDNLVLLAPAPPPEG